MRGLFAFNGTAANSLALSALCQSYHGLICAATSHVETDECGAPEFFSNGSKLLTLSTDDGKIDSEGLRELALRRGDIHFPRPRVVTISQSTETGRVYTVAELEKLSRTARDLNLYMHMDGARFANACASLDCSPADITWKAGVDVLCFGGTKNGMAVGETIVFLIRNWLPTSNTAASRPVNSHPRCAFWLHHGSACSRVEHGSAMHRTRMPVRSI